MEPDLGIFPKSPAGDRERLLRRVDAVQETNNVDDLDGPATGAAAEVESLGARRKVGERKD